MGLRSKTQQTAVAPPNRLFKIDSATGEPAQGANTAPVKRRSEIPAERTQSVNLRRF